MLSLKPIGLTAGPVGFLLSLFLVACSGSDGGGEANGGSTSRTLSTSGVVSDDFHTGTLDTQLWDVVDPQGDGTVELVGAGTPDAQLLLSVPAGTEHDAWTDNTALRVMQPAADEDFEIEVKFESEPTQAYQGQGLLVEQDGSNYVRLDVFSDGGSLVLFGATFNNSSPSVIIYEGLTSTSEIYLRLGRTGNQFTARYSYDGLAWTTAATFNHTLTVWSVGVFASNFEPNPAYTAVVDYFFETSSPIASEDPPLCDPSDQLVLTTQSSNGTILRNPDQSTYSCGSVVTLTAQPDVGATFLGWAGALSGTTNPAVLTLDADATVVANFLLDTTAPQISNVNAVATETSATVSWQTDELSMGLVEYGLTAAYEIGSVVSGTLATAHSVTLPGLSEGTDYHYRVTGQDSFGNSGSTADAIFTTGTSGGTGGTGGTAGSGGTGGSAGRGGTGGSAGSGGTGGTAGSGGSGGTAGTGGSLPGAFLSDDFYAGTLDTQLWDVVDPQGDGTVELVGAGTPDAQLLLSVPAGTEHDAWTDNTALRVMQPAADEDFEIEVKFESEPTQAYQGQGLLVEQDGSNYVRLDVFSDGGSLVLFGATFNNSSPSVIIYEGLTSTSEIYLRLGRTGNQFTARYSYDGLAWTTAATFNHTLTVWSVGVFASNFEPNPAYTAVVDYFFETSAPIEPEDAPGCGPGDQFVVTASTVGSGTVTRDPDQSTYACGESVTFTAQPGAGASFTGWSGALTGTQNPVSMSVQADVSVTATFALDSSPPQISNLNAVAAETSATVSWQTDEPSTGLVEYGETTAYELGSVASSTLATAHSVTLPGLSEGTDYHYRVTADDSLGNSATSADATFTTGTSGGPDGPEINVWYGSYQRFGASGIPQRFINVLGDVQDPDGFYSFTYSLNGGPESQLSIGPDEGRLQSSGDFNVEIAYADLSPGLNDITIRAMDDLGNPSVETVQVEYIDNVAPSPNVNIDWSTVTEVSDVAQIVDGKWSLEGGGLRTSEIGYDRILAIGDLQWTDYEATAEFTLNASVDTGTGPVGSLIGLGMRWTGHYNWFGNQPFIGWHPLGSLMNYIWIDGDYTGLAYWESTGALTSGSGVTPEPVVGVPYMLKMRGETLPGGNVEYSFKMWPSAQSEPSGWGITYTSNQSPVGGSLIVVVHYADITLGNVAIVPVGN